MLSFHDKLCEGVAHATPRLISESERLSPQEVNVIQKPSFDRRENRGGYSGPRINERIRIPEVRVIGAEGEMLGVLETRDAIRAAREKGLDLVEVNPKAVPPVCKIMDFGKYKYEEKKKQSEAKKKQAVVELKEIKLRPKTEEHDLDTKMRHIRRFLEEGNKVKITCRFRGREITHPEMAQKQLDAMMEALNDVAVVELSTRMEGKSMTVVVAPRPASIPAKPGKKIVEIQNA